MALRARIVLAAGQGISNQQIAAQLDVTASTVGKWRDQYYLFGIPGLRDWGGRGRPTKYGDKVWQELRGLLRQPPDSKQRWTVRALAGQLGLPRSTVHDMLLLERGKLRRKPAARR
jgi:transposase